jgi:hypothetical protein
VREFSEAPLTTSTVWLDVTPAKTLTEPNGKVESEWTEKKNKAKKNIESGEMRRKKGRTFSHFDFWQKSKRK